MEQQTSAAVQVVVGEPFGEHARGAHRPTLRELDGPIPTVNRSNTLMAT
jgi:hypothetical protein